MFYSKIGESCATTGTGTFSLGGAVGAFRAWSAGPADGTDVFYYAVNDTGSIWELGYGTYAAGTPDTLARTLIASSTGSLINWASAFKIYSVPSAEALKHLMAPLINGVAAVPGWMPPGNGWLDYSLGIAVAWIKKRYISGTRTSEASHSVEGRHYLGLSGGAANIFASSPRHLWVDKGANSYTVTAADIGKVLAFDISGGNKVPTLPANGTTGIGHGFAVGLIGYGSTSNSLTLTPDASDAIETSTGAAGSAGATRSITGGQVVWVEWDGAKSVWRVRGDVRAALPAATQAEQEAGSITTAFVSPGRQQFHPSAAKAWCYGTYSAGTPSVAAGYNVTSLTDNGTGDVSVNLTTVMSSANWAPLFMASYSGAQFLFASLHDTSPVQAGVARAIFLNVAAGTVDPQRFTFVGFGDQ